MPTPLSLRKNVQKSLYYLRLAIGKVLFDVGLSIGGRFEDRGSASGRGLKRPRSGRVKQGQKEEGYQTVLKVIRTPKTHLQVLIQKYWFVISMLCYSLFIVLNFVSKRILTFYAVALLVLSLQGLIFFLPSNGPHSSFFLLLFFHA